MQKVSPRVQLIAHTVTTAQSEDILESQPDSTDAEYLTTLAGRACYQSFHRPNAATRLDEDYLKRTLFEQGHWSIAEHASATFYLEGVSRAFTHELIRHRHLSYSQLSQRFVDESDAAYVVPPAMRGDVLLARDLEQRVDDMLENYSVAVDELIEEGYSRKQAREAARAFLPNCIEAKIVVSGNLRAWHEVTQRRMQPDADAEMQEVMAMIYDELTEIAPAIFPFRSDDDDQ